MPDIDCDEQAYRRREVNVVLERAGYDLTVMA
jgi:hypothetical protein